MTPMQLDFASIAEADERRRSLLVVLATDERSGSHVRAISQAIVDHFQPGESFSPNDLRPYLPLWINRSRIGPTLGMLRRRGALRFEGKVTSTAKSTHGKEINQYGVVIP